MRYRRETFSIYSKAYTTRSTTTNYNLTLEIRSPCFSQNKRFQRWRENEWNFMHFTLNSLSQFHVFLYRLWLCCGFVLFVSLNETCWYVLLKHIHGGKRELNQMNHNMFASVLLSRSLKSVVKSGFSSVHGLHLLIEIWIFFFPALPFVELMLIV